MLMFACIYGQVFPKDGSSGDVRQALLIDLAFTFSHLVERTSVDTVVLDISGDELLFSLQSQTEINWTRSLSDEIARRAAGSGLKVNVSVAANPDVAIHAARTFKGVTVVAAGAELSRLGNRSIKLLDYSLVGIDEKKAEEIAETLALWGIRTFGDFAKLPLAGVAQRLGQEGVRLQKLAQGKSDRQMVLVQPPVGFEQSLELEHPIAEIEPLSFILSRLLNQLCANLNAQALATNELRLRLVTEPGADRGPQAGSPLAVDTTGSQEDVGGTPAYPRLYERTITLPVPMRNPKTFLRLLLFDIEAKPPQAAITAVTIAAEPVKPRISQTGLFIPLAPEPERLEVTLARLAKLVGANNVGSPELLDTHRPDAFRMKRFNLTVTRKKGISNPQFAIRNSKCLMGFRMFRPSWRAEVQTLDGEPVRIAARSVDASSAMRGKIVCASGPWRSSGDWWRADVWARDEWDVAIADSNSGQSDVLCRIYRDLASEEWFVEGVYD
jgi:protein ImuB